jgi:hypothetical protein
MNDQLTDPIEAARRSYAEELRFTAHIRSRAVFTAFAAVPRERFVGAGPWRVRSPMDMAEYWTTEDGDPRAVYHDVLIALDERRQINNGQPSLWAFLLDQLDVAVGEQALHLGCGTGYYTAVVAELVGRMGPGRGLIGDRRSAIGSQPSTSWRGCARGGRTSRLPRQSWSALKPCPSVQPIVFGPATGASACSDSLADSASNLRNSR